MDKSRFAISTCTARYERYIPVRQVAGTRTAHYQAVPPKIDRRQSISAVSGRLREKSTMGGRLREKSTVDGRLREKRRKKEKRSTYFLEPSSSACCRCASSLPVGRQCLRAVAALESRALFLPREETERLPAAVPSKLTVGGRFREKKGRRGKEEEEEKKTRYLLSLRRPRPRAKSASKDLRELGHESEVAVFSMVFSSQAMLSAVCESCYNNNGAFHMTR
ncbi:hypothetical protein GW17_00042970 [Ensete ventricosum]|nr:hypothetical protein GW17_00042970 [Ensete ventricosum]